MRGSLTNDQWIRYNVKQVCKSRFLKTSASTGVNPQGLSNEDKVRKAVLRNRVLKAEKLATAIHSQNYH